ncbi:MAG: HD domain-containing protein [Firmicutes bacterium]|nr:HD domain-containing protein [Bacillota bacterium]
MTQAKKKRISEEEVKKLYMEYSTPNHVKAHCRAVAETAVKLAESLNKHGYSLDLSLIKGAGLAHDVARTSDEHWKIGADALEALGYKDEADIIRVHMFYSPFNPVEKLNECDMVCLADRLVKEDKYVGLDERIEYILKKAPDKPEIVANIMARKAETEELLADIADVIGQTVDSLFSDKEI